MMLTCLKVYCTLSSTQMIHLLQIASQCTSNICTVISIQGTDVGHHLHRWPHEIVAHSKQFMGY